LDKRWEKEGKGKCFFHSTFPTTSWLSGQKNNEEVEEIMNRNCPDCGTELPVKTWSKCPNPNCGAKIHFKMKPNGKIGKIICHRLGFKKR